MLLSDMDLLNYQYLDKTNNNMGVLCYQGEAALRGDPRLHSLSLSSSSSPSSSSSSSVSSHRTGPPPISPTKRKLGGDQCDSDLDDNEHVAKMSRLFAAQLKPAGDYRSSRDARLLLPGALGVHPPWHAHHQQLASLEQPLALTKSRSSSSSAALSLPHAAERQQNRPSVITCAPASNRNCSPSHCPLSHPASYRRLHAGVSCDPVIEEHFRRSLGKNYRRAEAGATNSVSITGSVDDHFAKALGDAWQQIKNKGSPSSSGSSPNSSPDSRMISHSPSVVS
ncbi:transcription cofactor vestigial-like protein 4b [Synchiropus picturatus]